MVRHFPADSVCRVGRLMARTQAGTERHCGDNTSAADSPQRRRQPPLWARSGGRVAALRPTAGRPAGSPEAFQAPTRAHQYRCVQICFTRRTKRLPAGRRHLPAAADRQLAAALFRFVYSSGSGLGGSCRADPYPGGAAAAAGPLKDRACRSLEQRRRKQVGAINTASDQRPERTDDHSGVMWRQAHGGEL